MIPRQNPCSLYRVGRESKKESEIHGSFEEVRVLFCRNVGHLWREKSKNDRPLPWRETEREKEENEDLWQRYINFFQKSTCVWSCVVSAVLGHRAREGETEGSVAEKQGSFAET